MERWRRAAAPVEEASQRWADKWRQCAQGTCGGQSRAGCSPGCKSAGALLAAVDADLHALDSRHEEIESLIGVDGAAEAVPVTAAIQAGFEAVGALVRRVREAARRAAGLGKRHLEPSLASAPYSGPLRGWGGADRCRGQVDQTARGAGARPLRVAVWNPHEMGEG